MTEKLIGVAERVMKNSLHQKRGLAFTLASWEVISQPLVRPAQWDVFTGHWQSNGVILNGGFGPCAPIQEELEAKGITQLPQRLETKGQSCGQEMLEPP